MLDPSYIVGLVDGEGSFTVYIRNPDDKKKVKRRVVVEPRFYIKLVERDKRIFYELMSFFRCGNVYIQRDRRTNRQNCYRYEVGKRADLENIIIPFFKKHPPFLSSKREDFAIFCKLMEGIKRRKHLFQNGLRELYKMKSKMHQH